jgi:hypothetical protein
MSELSKVVSDLNLPKQLIEKGEAAFKAVLGPSITEISETFADSFRLRRFKNQVKILSKAQKILEDNNLKAKQVNLKVLVPLLEFSSLEEDELLQEKWSNLIANIVTIDGKTLLKQNCIDILKKISNSEAKLLDYLFHKIKERRIKMFYDEKHSFFRDKKPSPNDFPLHYFPFSLTELSDSIKISSVEI